MCEISSGPVIYSHSCMRAIWDHPRNITNDQARACGHRRRHRNHRRRHFLGPNTPTLEAMTRHLEYAVDLVGIDHVGISSDFSFDAPISSRKSPAIRTCLTRATRGGGRSSGWRPRRCLPRRTPREAHWNGKDSQPCSAATSFGWPSRPGAPNRTQSQPVRAAATGSGGDGAKSPSAHAVEHPFDRGDNVRRGRGKAGLVGLR